MTDSRIDIRRDELERVLELMDNFDTDTVELVRSSSSGIGYILNAHFETSIANTQGVYIVEITGVDKW